MFFLRTSTYSARPLTGIVLAFAMLDHIRMFFYTWNANPVDVAHTSWLLFLTRFLSHFFAPAVFLLTGQALWQHAQGKKKQQKI